MKHAFGFCLFLYLALIVASQCFAQVPQTGAGLPTPTTGGGSATWTQTDSNNGLSGTEPSTWTAANIGTANADRIVVVIWSGGSTLLSGVTIGGVSATMAVRESSEISGLDIWYAAVPTGTTANIVFSGGGNFTNPLAICGSLITTTATPAHTGSNAANTNPNSVVITVPTGGVGLAAILAGTGSLSFTWTNASLDVNVNNASNSLSEGNTVTAGSITMQTNGDTGMNNHMVAATWSP